MTLPEQAVATTNNIISLLIIVAELLLIVLFNPINADSLMQVKIC
jgi:hypothetical protein